nr:hypothetical protein [Tanacetum cinerariifolium]
MEGILGSGRGAVGRRQPPAPQDEDERELMVIQPHDPDYVLEPMYPEYIEDEHVLLAEEQPLPPVDSPTAELPGYVAESDPEKYEDDETEDGSVNYLMDRGDDEDDDDNDLSRDEADDEDKDEEEKENLAPTDSVVVIPTVDLAAISLPPEAEVERLLAMPTPPPSPLTSLSPPSVGERLTRCTTPYACPSPPPIPSPLLPSSGCPTQIQTLRMASTQALIDVVTAALPSPPLPPPIYIPLPIDHRDDIPEIEMPPRKRLCLSTLGSRYKVGESSTARPTEGQRIDYGFFNTLDAEERRREIGERVDLFMEDRIAHQETILIVEEEAYTAREAWDHSIRLSQAVHSELQTYREHQAQMVETLLVMGDMRQEMGDMHTELLALREQPRRARQPRSDARVPDHQDAPKDADSHI